MAEGRSEKPTQRRLQKAREKGDFPAAREFVAAIQFSAAVTLGSLWLPAWFTSVQSAFRLGLRQSFARDLTPEDLLAVFNRLSAATLRPLATLGIVLLAVTILFQLFVTGFGFSFARLAPSFDRLNPAARLRELPFNNLSNFVQALVMIPVMFWLTYSLVRDRLPEILRLSLLPVPAAAAATGVLIRDGLRKASFVLIVLGAVMLLKQRSHYMSRLRMSKQEIRDEHKESDGNPQTKARIRRIQRDMRRRNMMREVPTATAVIVNPTHYAVALKYEQGSMAAPRVVAKGKNYLAARIRQRAIENQVPIIENPPLAQALYKSVDIGQEIPAHLYRAVAEILAYIFRLMGNAKR
jgi:flagellar biosynthetic protein FlhB